MPQYELHRAGKPERQRNHKQKRIDQGWSMRFCFLSSAFTLSIGQMRAGCLCASSEIRTDFLQCLSQLVGTGCPLHAARNAFKKRDDLVHRPTFHERGHTNRVAGASAYEENVLDDMCLVVHADLYLLGASARRGVNVFHV